MKSSTGISGLALLALGVVFLVSTDRTVAQVQAPADKGMARGSATSSSAQQGAMQGGMKGAMDAKEMLPYKPSVRVHLEKGANKGYLVLQVDLAKGHHLYSLNPKGSPAPTQIVVSPSKDINVLGAFAADKKPLVIEKDPIFQRRIEKHKGVVQFFAPIEVRPGMDLSKLSAEVTLTGQVCSDTACRQVKAEKVAGKFASFFELPKEPASKAAASTAQQPVAPAAMPR